MGQIVCLPILKVGERGMASSWLVSRDDDGDKDIKTTWSTALHSPTKHNTHNARALSHTPGPLPT